MVSGFGLPALRRGTFPCTPLPTFSPLGPPSHPWLLTGRFGIRKGKQERTSQSLGRDRDIWGCP